MLQARGGARASGEDVEGDGRPVDVARHVRLAAHGRVEVGVGGSGHRDRVPARQHRERLHERLRRRLLQQIGQDEHEGALDAADLREGELVVALDRHGLEVEQRRHDVSRAGPPRRQGAEHLAGERDRAAAVAQHVRHGRDRDSRVERGVEPRAVGERSRHQPAAVDDADDVPVALDPVLVAHRPPEAGRRAPVHLAEVVVGDVVADRLELGAEAERPAPAEALVPELARPDRAREPAGSRQVRIDEHVGGLADLMRPRREPERPGAPGDRRRKRVAAAPARDELSRSARRPPARGSSSRSGGSGWRTRMRDGLGRLEAKRRGHAAGEMRRRVPHHLGRPPHPPGVDGGRGDERDREQDGHRHRQDEQRDGDERQRERGARRRRHRGTGTASRAARTASSAV